MIKAVLESRATEAEDTPSKEMSALSIAALQDEQCMPSTDTCIW